MVQSIVNYSIDVIKDEARHLVWKGLIRRQQPIYTLCKYIPARDWVGVECALESCGYLPRDPIGDLMGREDWDED